MNTVSPGCSGIRLDKLCSLAFLIMVEGMSAWPLQENTAV